MNANRLLRVLSTFVCVATVLPAFRAKKWWVRIFDFPRVHVSVLGFIALAGSVWQRSSALTDRLLRGLVSLAVVAQLLQIARYTRFAPKQVARKPDDRLSNLRLLVANIYMMNHHSRPLLKLIRQHNPDLILLLEPNRRWEGRLAELEPSYPYVLKHPQENTYGLCLYSRLELFKPEIRFLVQDDVPSIRTGIRLPNRNLIWFYGMHPKPPGIENHNGNFRGTGPRDAELLVLAQELRTLNEPVIVAGDFNDVGWSHTTRRFQRLGRLLDPRAGRGFYNTFHASYPLWRFPVDHLFHSEHFVVIDFERLSHIGSDHFPIFAVLGLDSPPRQQQAPARVKASDLAESEGELRG